VDLRSGCADHDVQAGNGSPKDPAKCIASFRRVGPLSRVSSYGQDVSALSGHRGLARLIRAVVRARTHSAAQARPRRWPASPSARTSAQGNPRCPGAIPGRGDLHERGAVSRRHRGRRDQAGTGIGLGQDLTWYGLLHPHPVLAGASARGHREPRDRASTHTTGFHPEIRERRRQETRVVIAHVRDIAVDHIGRRIDHAISGDHDFPHAGLSITAAQRIHMPLSAGWIG
jgi:ribosomal protein L27